MFIFSKHTVKFSKHIKLLHFILREVAYPKLLDFRVLFHLLFGNHGKYDISNLSGQSLPFVFILFVTLLQYKDEHLQHLQRT